MTYLKTMKHLLECSFCLPATARQGKQFQLYCLINVSILGLIYGGFSAFVIQWMPQGLPYNGNINLTAIVLAGLPAAFFMHAGATLFIWVFSKAIGGNSDFMTAFFLIGTACAALWPLAPFSVLLIAGIRSPFIVCLAGLSGCYALAVICCMLQQVFKLSAVRTILATMGSIIYTGCFLYLWV